MPNRKHNHTTSWICTIPGTVVSSHESVQLVTLIEALEYFVVSGQPSNCLINQVTNDSRQAGSDSLFVALAGSNSDGHDFISQAVQAGCSALLVEKGRMSYDEYGHSGLCVIEVRDSRKAYGALAETLFSHPAKGLTLFAVTGTNGKTTICYLLESVLRQAGKHPGILGTVEYRYYNVQGELEQIPSSFTTPEPMLLQETLRKMADNGVDSVIMEVSSHGLEQNRIGNLTFDVAAFTNLSRDHLDYHHDMEQYFSSKALLFRQHLGDAGKAIITFGENAFQWSERLQQICLDAGHSVLSCGSGPGKDIYPLAVTGNLRETAVRLKTPEGDWSFVSPLVGDFNVANLQTTFAMALAAGISAATISKALGQATGAPGRMQRIVASGAEQHFRPTVFVDYAHTPDALEQVLKTVKALPHATLYCVFGCGGDRDIGKRPLMGEIAGRYADVAILTDDNPRTEDSDAIITPVIEGLGRTALIRREHTWLRNRSGTGRGFVVIPDRHQAIFDAVTAATAGDIVLIAGKGHEAYQITKSGKRFFDDALEAAEALCTWSVPSLLVASKGQLIGNDSSGGVFGAIKTDSRTIRKNDIFLALRGERFDAHDYVGQVVEAGAGCLVLKYAPEKPLAVPVILVKDTEQALGDLASYRRLCMKEISEPKVAAITGSSGKTTVKEMCAAIFCEQWPEQVDAPSGRVLKTEGNFNNLIGLPLSLLPVSPKHKAVILEMGMNRPGEIERLTEIADPDIACIVNVHGAHLQGLGDIEGVAKAKGELFQACGKDTVLVINKDDFRVVSLAENHSQKKIFFAVECDASGSLDVYASGVEIGNQEEMAFTLHVGMEAAHIVIQVPGRHNISNALAAAAIAHAAGIDITRIANGLSAFVPTDRRMQLLDGPAGIRILNDTYNANPASMKAGLNTLCELGSESRVAVLGDMLELGPDSESLHREIGAHAADCGIRFLGLLGDFATATASGAIEHGMDEKRVRVFTERNECCAWLEELIANETIGQGSYLLVKGSRGMHLESLVERLIGKQ